MSNMHSIGERRPEEIAWSWSARRPLWAWGKEASASATVTSGKVKDFLVFKENDYFSKYLIFNQTFQPQSSLDRYLTGPTPAASQDYLTQDELVKSRAALKDEIKRWTHQRNPQVLSTKVLFWILEEGKLINEPVSLRSSICESWSSFAGSSGCSIRSISWGCKDGW